MRKLLQRMKKSKGQSLVELTIIMGILIFLLAGMAEFGYLLNQYVTLVDAAREGARYGSNGEPFIRDTVPFGINASFFDTIDETIEVKPGPLDPLTLDPATDDVVISFFSVEGTNIVRFPGGTYWSKYHNHASQISNADVQGRLDGTAPNTGLVAVEIFYDYHTILKMPFFPDPIPVHAYVIMPLSAAEPTPTPVP